MGYKRMGKNLSFADLAVSKSLENNRSLKMMEKINKVVKWKNIEALLMEHYEVGTSKEGADAYPPLMLLLPAHRAYSPEGKVCYSRNGSVFPQILNLRTRLMTAFLLSPARAGLGLSLDKPSPLRSVGPMGRRQIIRPFQDSAAGYPNKQ